MSKKIGSTSPVSGGFQNLQIDLTARWLTRTYTNDTMNTNNINSVYTMNPLFTLIGSAFLLGERLTMVALMGAVLILGGVYWAGKR